MQQNVITQPTAQRTPKRAEPVERAKANLRAALRLLDKPLDAAEMLTVNKLVGFALADLAEVEPPERAA
jgi:hypothetical protein